MFPGSYGNGGDESDRRSGDGESDLRQNGLEPRNIKTTRERFLEGLEKAEKEVAGANFDPCEEEFCNDDGAFGNDDDGGDFVNDDDGGDFECPTSISMPTPTPTKTARSYDTITKPNLTRAKRPYVKRNHEDEAARKLFKKKYDASEARLAAKAKANGSRGGCC